MKFIKLNAGVRINLGNVESYGKNARAVNKVLICTQSIDFYNKLFENKDQVDQRLKELDFLVDIDRFNDSNALDDKIKLKKISDYCELIKTYKILVNLDHIDLMNYILDIINKSKN